MRKYLSASPVNAGIFPLAGYDADIVPVGNPPRRKNTTNRAKSIVPACFIGQFGVETDGNCDLAMKNGGKSEKIAQIHRVEVSLDGAKITGKSTNNSLCFCFCRDCFLGVF
jgi:hypothetical protein